MRLRAGFARADITPVPGLPMGGYAARMGVAEGVLDALACRVAVLSDGAAPIVAAVVDLVYVAGPWAASVRRRIAADLGTSEDRVLLAATHTHSGPAVFRSGGAGRDRLDMYEENLAGAVCRTARAAAESLEEVELHSGVADVAGVGASRRDAAETIDCGLRAIFARRRDGSCAGALASFGCHPTILPPENLRYSRDLFGAAVDTAERDLGGTVLLFNGAAADVSTRFTRRAQSPDEVERLGGILGRVLSTMSTTRVAPATLSARVHDVHVELRTLAGEEEAMRIAEAASAEVARTRENGATGAALRLATSRLEGALAQVWLARTGGWEGMLGRVPERAAVQCLELGGVRLLAVPGEMMSRVGRRLSGGVDLVVGYANDYLGYLVPESHAGDAEYESLMAALTPASATAIERALAEMRHG